MTPKEQKFCDEYLIDLNATQAAIRAGYSDHTAGQIGHENLKKPEISSYIEERRSILAEKTGLTQQWVLDRLKLISDRCVQVVPVMEFDYAEKKMVQATTNNEQGEEVGVFTFDSSGANKATEMIGKHLGFFEKDNEQSRSAVNVNTPSTITVVPAPPQGLDILEHE